MSQTLERRLEALESSGLIRLAQLEPEGEYLFQHVLAHEVVYRSLLETDRKKLHLAVGESLERLYPDRLDELSPLVGQHFYQAGEWGRAFKYLERAADMALARYANREAEQYYRLALDIAAAPAERARVLAELGRALDRQGRCQETVQVWRAAMDLYRVWGDDDNVARLYARSARALWYAGERQRSLALCREGLADSANGLDTPGGAALLHETARACYFNGLHDQARRYCQQALQVAERLNAIEVQADALATLGILPGVPVQEATLALTMAVELSESAGLLATAIRAHNNLGVVLVEKLARLRAASGHYGRAVELARQRGSYSQQLLSALNAVDILLFLCDFERVEALLSALPALMTVLEQPASAAFGFCISHARLWRYRGQLARSVEVLQVCRAAARREGDTHHLNASARFLAEALIEMGKWEEAENVLRETLEISDDDGEWNGVWPLCMVCAARLRRGQLEAARSAWMQARQRAGAQPGHFDLQRLGWAEAQLMAAEGRWQEALMAYTAVIKIQADMDLRWYQARALQEQAEVYVARGQAGDDARACQALGEALAIYKALQVQYYADLVERRLAACQQSHFSE